MKTARTLALLTGNSLVGSGLSYLATVLLAREIGPEQFGEYNYIFLVGALISIFINYSTDATAAVSLSKNRDLDSVINDIYGMRIFGYLILIAGLLVLATQNWLLALGVATVVLPVLNTSFIFELLGRNSSYSRIYLLERIAFSGLIFAMVSVPILNVNIVSAILIMLACTTSSLIVQINLHYSLIKRVNLNIYAVSRIIRENIFLVLVSLATFAYGGLSRLALERNLGSEQLGIYSAGWQFVLLITIFSGQVARIWRLRFAKSLETGGPSELLFHLKEYLVMTTLPVIIGAGLFYISSDKVILLLFGTDYQATNQVTPWISVYFLIVNLDSLSTMLWTASGSRREFFVVTIIWSSILVLLLIVFSKSFSLRDYVMIVVIVHALSTLSLLARQGFLLCRKYSKVV